MAQDIQMQTKKSVRTKPYAQTTQPGRQAHTGRLFGQPSGEKTFSEDASKNKSVNHIRFSPISTDLAAARNQTLCQRKAYPDKKP